MGKIERKKEHNMENIKDQETETIEAEVGSTARMIKQVKRHTKKRYTAEEKVRIVLEGFRKELTVAELCRREGIHAQVYYGWLKDFMEAGKERSAGRCIKAGKQGRSKIFKERKRTIKRSDRGNGA